MHPRLRLEMLCIAMGIDLDEVIDRCNGPCMCGHARAEHETEDGVACACRHEGCGCPAHAVPPPTVPR